tara:strand:- start:507 stop:1508 length:1002 start_codon:yes stop_codon:yes gene_type:complete
MQQKKIGLYAKHLTGHRKEYLDFIQEIIPSQQSSFKNLFLKKEPIIFLMIEDSPLTYLFISIYRSIFQLKTVGFLFRPLPIFKKDTFRMKIKYLFLRVLKLIPKIQTILIVPDSLHIKFEKICDGWIYDMQLWDISDDQLASYKDLRANYTNSSLVDKIKLIANGRKVVCAIGSQNKRKGFHIFADTFIENPDIRHGYLFIFGGKLEGCTDLLEKFERFGGMSFNRFVSEEELIALYASSDLVWAFYDEEYDQASGIFGRALQFGVPSIIRSGSLVDRLCKIEKIPSLALTTDNINLKSLEDFLKLDKIEGKNYKINFKNTSILNLKKAIELS